MSRQRLGELLVEDGILTRAQVERALAAQRARGERLGDVLTTLGFINETQLTQALSRQLSVPWVSLHHIDFTRHLLSLVPRELAETHCLVPIFVRRIPRSGETLYVAMDDPTSDVALEKVQSASKLPVRPMIACPSDVRNAIRAYYGESDALAQTGGDRGLQDETYDLSLEDLEEAQPPPERSQLSGTDDAASLLSVKLRDGSTVSLPTYPSTEDPAFAGAQLTARDLIATLRALAHGVDVTPILGDNAHWPTMFGALLSLMLKKGLIADWEYVEEFRRMVASRPRMP